MEETLIVGAGPAGCTAAIELARRGRQVLLLERGQLGRTKICAGGLPPKALGALPTDISDLVQDRCSRIRFQLAGRDDFTLRFQRPVVHMVDRAALDRRLVDAALDAGVCVRPGVRVRRLIPQSGGVLVESDQGLLRARAVIAADGALGVGARLLGRAGVNLLPALQVSVPRERPGQDGWTGWLACDFGRPKGGIGWVFPKRHVLSVGVCAARRGLDLKQALADLLRQYQLPPEALIQAQRQPIPVWAGRRKFSCGAVLVAGDAAGLANPLSGAGIRRACVSGRLAAETLHAFLAGGGGDTRDLAAYDRRVRAELVNELIRARWLARIFYGAPGLFYRMGVVNARINPWVEQLLSGQKDYREVVAELVRGTWLLR